MLNNNVLNTGIDFAGFDFTGVVAIAAPLPVLRAADVIRAYSGKPGCMCGCRGRYYVGKADASSTEACGSLVSDHQVKRIVSTINASARQARRSEGFNGAQIISFETAGRSFVAYVRAGVDLSAFEVES